MTMGLLLRLAQSWYKVAWTGFMASQISCGGTAVTAESRELSVDSQPTVSRTIGLVVGWGRTASSWVDPVSAVWGGAALSWVDSVSATFFLSHLSHRVGKPTILFPNRSDTNRAVQAQKMARDWKFGFRK